ncbi:substrate-binding domain-containing protein [Caldimonas tepidiphila]|uniref:substrate-binding domain-containing protein n=1 Tax=Caldimonas tepidiphila TaxID=2315841 RepID=UPI0013006157|nr:substrate-binding domain-containing protein [Caldimonas tepidiphila]
MALTLAWSASAAVANPAPLSGELTIGGTGAALGLMQKLGEEFRKSHPAVQFKVLPSLGSGGGIKALLAGRLTLSVSSRPLKDDERQKGASAKEIARTPLVFATGLKTPVSSLTLEQIAALYSGKTSQWSDGSLVRPVLRPLDDIDTHMVRAMSPALEQALQTAHAHAGKNIAITDTDTADELERIPGSFGSSTLTLIRAEGRALKILAVDGIQPLAAGQVNPRYPYLKSIYLVAPAAPSALAQAFAEFVGSAAGAKVLVQTGNVPTGAGQ